MAQGTRTPAQAALAEGRGGPSASPRPSPSSQSGVAPERETPIGQGPRDTEPRSRAHIGRGATYPCAWESAKARSAGKRPCGKPHHGCGGHNRQKEPCGNGRGKGTDHGGSGNCANHGGRTESGSKAAAEEQAARALHKLGQPVGSGSPLQLLEKAVRYADGNLEASAALLVEIVAEQEAEKPNGLLIDAARELFTQAIRLAGRVGKEAADAHIAERRASIDEMIVGLLERVLLAGLEEIGANGDQREAALARMHRELVAVLPEPAELN